MEPKSIATPHLSNSLHRKKRVALLAWGQDISRSSNLVAKLLKAELENLGLEITPRTSSQIDLWIELETSPANARIRREHVSKTTTTVLVVFEPRMVNPYQYRNTVRREFDQIISLSKEFLNKPSEIEWHQGHLPELREIRNSLARFSGQETNSKSIAIVNENKTSAISSSLYSFRIDCIRSLSKAGFKVALAGKNWDRPKRWHLYQFIKASGQAVIAYNFPDPRQFRFGIGDLVQAEVVQYSGPCWDSTEFQAEHKFNLVIENEKTYVSEKLFNSLLANQVPIYVGPSLADFGIPKEVALAFSGSAKQLPSFLNSITESEVSNIREAGRKWLTTQSCVERWSLKLGVKRLAEQLVKITMVDKSTGPES